MYFKYAVIGVFMAVREGFEPSVPKRYSDLAGQCIRPLCHLTKLTKYIVNGGRLETRTLKSYDAGFQDRFLTN